jgi:formylglycine-generating enzyme required for sulfatase activity
MGSDPAASYPPDDDEAPRHAVRLLPFRLARTPVTNAQYGAFVGSTGYPAPAGWPDGTVPAGEEDVPVTYATWDDARAFCAWAGVRLPTEAEWEAAARGGGDRLWPWGDEPPSPDRALFSAGIGRPGPAGRHPHGASADGLLDLAGNVWEWVSSVYRPYPYDPADGRESPETREPRVVRGGSFLHEANDLRCSCRHPMHRGARDHYVGFRVAAGESEPRLAFDWVDLPGGELALGRDPVPYGGECAADEVPQHLVYVPAFELSLTPVTQSQYTPFVREGGVEPPADWEGGSPPRGRDDHPVTFVDWFDARAYCTWAGGRLPTEAEWEKAARGSGGRLYPWGAEHDPSRAVIGAGQKHGSAAPVAAHPSGASPYGLLDMAGNVWEWVSSAYRPYPYDPADGRENLAGAPERVLRGGSFMSADLRSARCAMRSRSRPGRRQAHIGFRVARGDPA